jgi:hypothetical protein
MGIGWTKSKAAMKIEICAAVTGARCLLLGRTIRMRALVARDLPCARQLIVQTMPRMVTARGGAGHVPRWTRPAPCTMPLRASPSWCATIAMTAVRAGVSPPDASPTPWRARLQSQTARSVAPSIRRIVRHCMACPVSVSLGINIPDAWVERALVRRAAASAHTPG